jgi:hypothetical protein
VADDEGGGLSQLSSGSQSFQAKPGRSTDLIARLLDHDQSVRTNSDKKLFVDFKGGKGCYC